MTKRTHRTLFWLSAILLIPCSLAGRPARANTLPGDNIVLRWDEATLQAIRDTKPGPTIVSRALAVVHTSMYDAWAAYDATAVGTRLGGALRHPASERTLENKNAAISYAAYRTLVDLFPQPAEVAKANALMAELGYDPSNTSMDATTAVGTGNVCADAVLQLRHHDGSNQLGDLHSGPYTDYSGYTPVNTPDQIIDVNHWQPLRIPDGHGGFMTQVFTTPFWTNVTPFALTSGSEFRPEKMPYMFNEVRENGKVDEPQNQDFIKQAKDLIHISEKLTDEQKMIAEYWADGPNSELPPGHWCLISQYVSRRDHHSLDDDAKMFFAVANAVMDAGIACWDCKRVFDSVRPITAIHYLFKDKWIRAWAGPYKGTQLIKGQDWQPYQAPNVVTPPFAECISGHSTFSASAAEVLRSFTGSDDYGASVTFPAGSSKFEAGMVPAQDVTLHWDTFSDAADQAGISRRYGGIHFEVGDMGGRKIGRLVGAQVWAKAQTYFDGTAAN